MQLRALIKRRKRKWAMVVLGVVVCAAAVWLLLDAGHKPTDEEKFKAMLRSQSWGQRWASTRIRHSLPTPLDRAVKKLEVRSAEHGLKLRGELVASGYLASFPVTNLENMMFLLRYGTETLSGQVGTNCYVSFNSEGNNIFMTCRPNDAPRIRALIEKKP